MAKKWTNRNLPGALHFVTGNVLDRRQIFKKTDFCRAFLEELQELRTKRNSKVIAFVLMPEHFHFIANPMDGEITQLTGSLKSLSARRMVELAPQNYFVKDENQVWQESFKALPLWSGWMIWQKINYIHANPVRSGLVKTAGDYPWSSFRSFYNDETDPLVQVDKEWWWPDDVQKLAKAVGEADMELEKRILVEREGDC